MLHSRNKVWSIASLSLKKCVRLKRGNIGDPSSSVFTFISSFYPVFFKPNMSSSSALTSCSPYWLSSVFHKQPRLHFKGDDLCPPKRMNEGPYLRRSALRSAARCYFALMRSFTLNSTHDYYYHGCVAATDRRGVLIYCCDHCQTCYKPEQVVKITCRDHMR